MSQHSGKVRLFMLPGVLALAFLGTAAAQKASAPKPQDPLAAGEPGVRQLLLLMDMDKNGAVSKEAYMRYMEAEFRRLDLSHEGTLNAFELNQSTISASRFTGK